MIETQRLTLHLASTDEDWVLIHKTLGYMSLSNSLKSAGIHTSHRVVLLVEDNENDAELTKLAFAHANLGVELHRVDNGEECLLYLRKQGAFAHAPTPSLILLDLHMPRMNGLEVLAELDRDERLRHIPVVMLTTSDAASDVAAAYQLRCNSYVVKPVGFEALTSTLSSLTHYWLVTTSLPPIQVHQDSKQEDPADVRTGTHI